MSLPARTGFVPPVSPPGAASVPGMRSLRPSPVREVHQSASVTTATTRTISGRMGRNLFELAFTGATMHGKSNPLPQTILIRRPPHDRGVVLPKGRGRIIQKWLAVATRLQNAPRMSVTKIIPRIVLPAILFATTVHAEKLLFQDDFKGKLGEGWSWVREHRAAWRVSERGLEVRIEPGNMWGKANDAKNVLVRPAPDPGSDGIEITVTVENRPTAQYEQVDLVWYYDDSHMVKLGQELVNGKLSIVMGREEKDLTRTIKLVPLGAFKVQLRFAIKGNSMRGQFAEAGSHQWQDVGECDLPAPPGGAPKISLQFYQGPADAEHWARVSEFRVRRLTR